MGKVRVAPKDSWLRLHQVELLLKLKGVSYEIAKEALRLAAQKLPITTKFVVRRDYDIQNQNA